MAAMGHAKKTNPLWPRQGTQNATLLLPFCGQKAKAAGQINWFRQQPVRKEVQRVFRAIARRCTRSQ